MCGRFEGPWELYDYKNYNNVNEIAEWTRGLEKKQRTKLNHKLDMLTQIGPSLPPQLLAGPISDHVYKLKVQGNVQLRPMVCKGPINNEKEFTLLLGAREVGGNLVPRDAPQRAERNRAEIVNDRERRCEHERITA